MYNSPPMRDDEIDDLPEELSLDDTGELMEQLDSSFAEMGFLEEHPLRSGVLSRQEMDDLVDRSIAEELSRLNSST